MLKKPREPASHISTIILQAHLFVNICLGGGGGGGLQKNSDINKLPSLHLAPKSIYV